MRLTLKERVFYSLVCSEHRVYRHRYTRFLLAEFDLERIRRVVARIKRWADWAPSGAPRENGSKPWRKTP